MRILALAINFHGFTFETLFREQMALKKVLEESGHEVIFWGPGFDYTTNDVAEVVDRLTAKGCKPDLLLSYLSERLFWEPLPESVQQRYELSGSMVRFPVNVEKVTGITKVMWINDFWHMTPEQWDFTLLGYGFEYALATYVPPYLRVSDFTAAYSTKVRKTVQFLPSPRSADPELFRSYGDSRDIDVCLLGAKGDFYELRNYFHYTLSRQTWLNYFSREHPGYDYGLKDSLTNEAYARVLARSKIFVSCTGRYRVPFIKISEVLASGALLMCDRPTGAEELGLVDGLTYVEVDKVNFMEKLHDYLHNPKALEAVARRGQQLFLERHTAENHGQRTARTLLKIAKGHVKPSSSTSWNEDDADGPVAPAKCLSERFVGYAQKCRERLLGRSARSAARNQRNEHSRALSPWLNVSEGSCLNWKQVVECRHALEICQLNSVDELLRIERYGLNAYWGACPVITAFPETVSIRPKILALLAESKRAMTFCEVGTARGLQSIFWAEYLKKNQIEGGRIFTCDIDDHETPRYRTPLDGNVLFSRHELWQQTEVASAIEFICGDSQVLSRHLESVLDERAIDMFYVDAVHDEESVIDDYRNMERYLAPEAILIFDDCDPRFPGVEEAVSRIAEERQADIRLISFWPSPYKVAVLGWSESLAQLTGQVNSNEGASHVLTV